MKYIQKQKVSKKELSKAGSVLGRLSHQKSPRPKKFYSDMAKIGHVKRKSK